MSQDVVLIIGLVVRRAREENIGRMASAVAVVFLQDQRLAQKECAVSLPRQFHKHAHAAVKHAQQTHIWTSIQLLLVKQPVTNVGVVTVAQAIVQRPLQLHTVTVRLVPPPYQMIYLQTMMMAAIAHQLM